MQKNTTALEYYMAENMTLARLKNEVCEQDAGTCRACDCFKACAIGRRYVQEVEAGLIMVPGAAPANESASLVARERLKFLGRIAKIQAGIAEGKSDQMVAEQAGYSCVKYMRRAINRFNAREGNGREGVAL